MSSPKVLNLTHQLSRFDKHWTPHTIAMLNDYEVKVSKFQGPFIWHSHPESDEMFLVLKGEFTMGLRDGDIEVKEGEMIVVPKGLEHQPKVGDEEECSVLVVEPKGMTTTGDQEVEGLTRKSALLME